MAKRNYKVYADIGVRSTTVRRVLSVLDTEAGPNFIRRDELGEDPHHLLKQGPLPDIYDANNRPLDMLGTISLAVGIGKFSAMVTFIVCKTLAARAVLGTDFCDRYVNAIGPKRKLVELEDGSTIPIAKRPLRTAFRKPLPPLPAGLENLRINGRCSATIKAAETIHLLPHSQTWVKEVTNLHGLSVLQSNPMLYAQFQIACANGVQSVTPDVPFKILIANLCNEPRVIVRNQNVTTALENPLTLAETSMTIGHFLGISERDCLSQPQAAQFKAALTVEHPQGDRSNSAKKTARSD